jgi:SH3-like domain-containing protein
VRRTSIALLACAGLMAGAGASAPAASAADAAARPRHVTICAARATLYESPGGAKVGILHRGDKVKVIAFGTQDAWWRVVAAFGTRGWLKESAVCARHR